MAEKQVPRYDEFRIMESHIELDDAERGGAVTETVQNVDHAEVAGVRTFLIADVRGYTRFTLEHGDEAAAKLAAKFAATAREVVAGHDGQVIELRGDEALAVFSSARQALRAAVDMQAQFSRDTMGDTTLPMRVGIGLDAGEAIPVEGGYRGAALNLAARLCSLAGPGEVLATESVAHLARKLEGLSYTNRGAVQLKGFADPVRVVHVASGEVEQPADDQGQAESIHPLPIGGFLGALPSTPLVARGDELQKLLSIVDAVTGGSGRLALLAGEPGVGKTRLAQEVTLHLRDREFLVASGRCYEPQEAVPFYPFLEALETLYSAAPAPLRAEVTRRWPYLTRLLPNESSPAPWSLSEGKEEQERLFWSVAGFLQAISEEVPVALLLDDLHWADSTSLGLLQHLARHTRAYRVLLLGTYRDVEVGRQRPLERALRDLNREQLVERVVIRRLGQEGTATLIATTFGEEQVSTEFAELVYRHTEGNPFFTHEVLHALVERGDIYRENGRWERRKVGELWVPESVRSVIGERLSRLSEAAQEILYEASVLGQTFAFDDLQEMSGRQEDEIEEALEEATGSELLRVVGKDDYAFNHALTHQTLYAELSPRRRRRLHRAAGEALEQLPERIREQRVAELARHFLEGDDTERALRYSMLAGEEADSVFAHAEAERHYRAALELARELGDQEREAQALKKLGAVLEAMTRFDEALELFEQATLIYSRRGELREAASVVAAMAHAHFARGTPEDGLARLRPAIEQLREAETSSELSALYAAEARLSWVIGEIARAHRAADQAAEVARIVGDEAALAWAEVWQGTALDLAGRSTEALTVLEDAIGRAERADPGRSLHFALICAGESCRIQGRFAQAKAYWERALAANERANGPEAVSFDLMNLAQLLTHLGEWKQARAYAERAAAMTEQRGRSWDSTYPTLELGELAVLEGDLGAAVDHATAGLAMAEQMSDVQGLRLARMLLAQVDLLSGRSEAALAALTSLIHDDRLPSEQVTLVLPLAVEAMLETGKMDEAAAMAVGGVERATTQNNQLALVDMLRIQGLVLARQGQHAEAEKTLEEAIRRARKMPYPYAEARGLSAWGHLLSQQGDQQQGALKLQEALAIFQRLGARRDVEQTEQALAQLQRA